MSTAGGTTGGEAERDEVARRLRVARELASEAGEVARRAFDRQEFRVEQKGDGSPVTTADREAERLLRAGIERAFPDDAILGEEYGERPGTSGFRWLVDPIDGTKSFVRGVPLFGTLVGVERAGRPVAGVIHMPALGESVWGGQGIGARHAGRDGQERAARVSGVCLPGEALFCTTSWDYYRGKGLEGVFDALCRTFGSMRGWSDCYAYLLVATGRADVAVEPGVHPWDVAAVIAVVEAAGGRATDWSGATTSGSGTSLASNGVLHDAVLRVLAARGVP